jgi:hypothetical protein
LRKSCGELHNAITQNICDGGSVPKGFGRTPEEGLCYRADRPQPSPATGVIRPSAGKSFREDAAPWVLKGGYALELRFKAARSTVDIDLTVQRVAASAGSNGNQIVREMLQSAANAHLGDWLEFVVGPPVIDLTAAPYGGARYPVEARMDERILARFHLDAGIGDVVMRPLETSCAGTGRDSLASNRRVS